ncbi:Acyl-coA synthetase family protein [Cocos nucifera]|nr:Acyl-coA synthetase family protein [Cocos nucifera]
MMHLIEVEKGREASDGRPSVGPTYRSAFAKDGFPLPVPGVDTCWDVFRLSAERCPNNRMLGRREIVDGKPGKYVWMTYKEVYDIVMKIGASIRSLGVEQGGRCGIYGSNCPEWVISMEACNAHGIYCVPLYDTLEVHNHSQQHDSAICDVVTCAGAVEFILCHSEVQIAFAEEKKIGELHEGDVYLSYLPLAHIFDRVIEELFIFHGASIGFWRGDVKLLVEDIGELKPTIFCAVPRVLDRIYTVQPSVVTALLLTFLAMDICPSPLLIHELRFCSKFRNMSKGSKHEDAAAIFDKVVFNKVRGGLGGRVRIILSGAAPLSTHVEEFLRVVTCSHVLQGYGLTETCAGTFVTLPNNLSMLGTVGPPVPNVDVRLESVPEMNYDALGEVPRGEICVRGNTLFSGYYKSEDLTKEVMIDGWFHTGDIGEWQPDGSMKIIDRKKNIFKLSQGEYVAVENLENVYGLVPDIDSIYCEILAVQVDADVFAFLDHHDEKPAHSKALQVRTVRL